jgi:hypothetical protein
LGSQKRNQASLTCYLLNGKAAESWQCLHSKQKPGNAVQAAEFMPFLNQST